MERIIEICCGSYEDALNAYHGGAKRIELNSALYLGGLTPSLASLKLTKKNTNLKVITMVRPRGAGFCYNEIEFEVMKEDAKSLSKLLKDMNGHVNLIPVNEIKENTLKRPSKKTIEDFEEILKAHGIEVTVRREMGTDINAACGQLRRSYLETQK